MSLTSKFGKLGIVVGLGFGIFASVKNFDADAHQSEEMSKATREFSELLTQIGMVGLQSASMGFLFSLVGSVIDCVTCCKFVDPEEYQSLPRPGSSSYV